MGVAERARPSRKLLSSRAVGRVSSYFLLPRSRLGLLKKKKTIFKTSKINIINTYY